MENTKKDLLQENGFKLHHIGFATFSIKESLNNFVPFLLSKDLVLSHIDIEQKVKVEFYKLKEELLLEFVAPLDKGSPVNKVLEKNPKGLFHHLAYEVEEYEENLKKMKDLGYKRITQETTGFENRKINFFLPKSNLETPLIEIISRPNC